MTIDTNLVYWNWEQGGQTWGFDPRTTPSIDFEKAAVDALSDSQKTTIIDNHMWACVRKQRDNLLIECDWVGGTDVPDAIKTKWNNYRQQLRDVTDQSDPDNITWPTKPS
jgi:hypothetical protein